MSQRLKYQYFVWRAEVYERCTRVLTIDRLNILLWAGAARRSLALSIAFVPRLA